MTAPLRDAATVVVLRETERGGVPEVLLVRRHAASGFAARAWVFPGGTVDEADTRLDPACWTGVDPDALAVVVGRTPEVALGLCVAAVRETFEEAGLLFAHRARGGRADPGGLRRAPGRFHTDLAAEGLVLDLGALVPFMRWRTPTAEPRRYDAIFFVAVAPADQVADHDRVELTESRWVTAQQALDERLPMIFPTVHTLRALAALGGVDAVLSAVPPGTRLRPLQPHAEVDADGAITRLVHPDDPAYPWHLYPELAS